MDFASNVEGVEDFDSQLVRRPWIKGKPLDPGLFDDVQISVYEARDDEGKFFVVKEVRIDPNQRSQLETLVQELKMYCGLRHKNIVQYMGTEIATGDKTICVFLKLMGRSLLSTLDNFGSLSEMQVRCYTLHILNGLKYLHVDKKIVHGDIRCATIWVDDDGICKLTGFRLPEELITKIDPSNSRQTRISWTAPESYEDRKKLGFHSDIWSLGCTVIEMAGGSRPYGDLDEETCGKVIDGETPAIPDALPEDGKDFVKQCLQVDYVKRPVVTDLLEHPFVKAARHVMPSKAQGKQYPRTGYQTSLSNQDTYVLFEKEHQVVHGLTFTTKTGTVELQGSDMADPKKHFEVANNTITLINDLRKQYYDRPADLVLHKSAESRHSKETFKEVYADICDKIENRTSDLYILDAEWMGQLSYEDRVQIQNQFEDAGYFETVNTDKFICLENVASLSGLQFLPQLFVSSMEFTSSSNVPSLSHSHLGEASSQREFSDVSLPSTSHLGQTTSQGGSSNTSSDHQGDSRKPGQLEISPSSKLTLEKQVASENKCGDACRPLKLHVSSSREEEENFFSDKVDLNFASQEFNFPSTWSCKIKKWLHPTNLKPKIRVWVSLRCCMDDGNFCIKLSFLKGQVTETAEGTALKSLIITLAACVEGEPIQLTYMPIDNNIVLRVLEQGKAEKDIYKPRRKYEVRAQLAPSCSVSPSGTPSVNLGSVDLTPNQEMQIALCKKDQELTLVSLEKGSKAACEDLTTRIPIHHKNTTLVLKRNLLNTWCLEKQRERPCVQMNDTYNPVKLITNVSDFLTVDPNSKHLKITCCVESEISFISSDIGRPAGQKITEGERQSQIVPFHEYFTMQTA